MKRLIRTAALIFAVINFISVSAQNMSDSFAVADTYTNDSTAFSDSAITLNYINLSKQFINTNPDSSLYWANMALKTAGKLNNAELLQKAINQRKIIQQYNFNKNDNDAAVQSNQLIKKPLFLLASLLFFAACIFIFILYVRKNTALNKLKGYYEKLENKNDELMLFKKETIAKDTEEKIIKEAETQHEDILINIKDRLIPMIAHDIRSPLASVQNMLSLTRENILAPEEFQKLSYSLEADIYNLRGMLDNMLLWTREQMVDIKVNKILFNISDVVKEVILMHRNSLIAKNITINNYLHPDVEVFSDKEITTAVIRNIFSNAVKFTPPNKNIYINQIYLNKKIYISVKDEGKGMNEETIEKLRSNEHISTRGTANEKGTGIGIMFTKDLLKKIGDVFDITSMPGQGTSVSFSVSMPEQQKNLN